MSSKLKVSRNEQIECNYLKAEMATLLINRSDRSFDHADKAAGTSLVKMPDWSTVRSSRSIVPMNRHASG